MSMTLPGAHSGDSIGLHLFGHLSITQRYRRRPMAIIHTPSSTLESRTFYHRSLLRPEGRLTIFDPYHCRTTTSDLINLMNRTHQTHRIHRTYTAIRLAKVLRIRYQGPKPGQPTRSTVARNVLGRSSPSPPSSCQERGQDPTTRRNKRVFDSLWTRWQIRIDHELRSRGETLGEPTEVRTEPVSCDEDFGGHGNLSMLVIHDTLPVLKFYQQANIDNDANQQLVVGLNGARGSATDYGVSRSSADNSPGTGQC